jgi:aspartate-semialdehyde dehydrogenase
MKKINVAVVGATGAVGHQLLSLLDDRNFPVGTLRPLASARSAGTTINFRGEAVTVEEATPDSFGGMDIVFFAATGSLSKELAPAAAKAGAVVIDKSSTWRMDPNVPLVVPEINPEDLGKHKGIIASPNCTTIGLIMALKPLHDLSPLTRVIVTTMQAVSGTGMRPLTSWSSRWKPGSPARRASCPTKSTSGRSPLTCSPMPRPLRITDTAR